MGEGKKKEEKIQCNDRQVPEQKIPKKFHEFGKKLKEIASLPLTS